MNIRLHHDENNEFSIASLFSRKHGILVAITVLSQCLIDRPETGDNEHILFGIDRDDRWLAIILPYVVLTFKRRSAYNTA